MSNSTSIFPICRRIKSLVPNALFWVLHLKKKVLFPRQNLCFVRPHSSLVKERLLAIKNSARDMSSRPNQQLALRPQDKESSPLKREASQANNCSLDSRQQRFAVYAYLWARKKNIQLKHILFIRTKE